MLIFIENTPRAYAWGSADALPAMLGTEATGEPQAELWLGAHPGHPASVAKATAEPRTLIDLIASDPERWGVDGEHLPFLMKVLAIGAPLSLQVHPDSAQAVAGFEAEEARGVPRDAPHRNYGDPHHKPELLVALGEMTAMCGFRAVQDIRRDLLLFAAAAPEGESRDALHRAADLLVGEGAAGASGAGRAAGADAGEDRDSAGRRALLEWALSGDREASVAVHALSAIARAEAPGPVEDVEPLRMLVLRNLAAAHPGDAGILVSVMLHVMRLYPGEAVYLGARQLHAYLGGIGVEVMASSDNVLRAGLTVKHVDADEVCRIVDTGELGSPKFAATRCRPGLVAWRPAVPDFQLMRARLHAEEDTVFDPAGSAEQITLEAPYPLVLIATEGRVLVERPEAEFTEVAAVRRGRSLYVSAGDPIQLSGSGEVFLATVGEAYTAPTEA